MNGEQLAARLGEGWKAYGARSAKRGGCVVYSHFAKRRYCAEFIAVGSSGPCWGDTPEAAVEKALQTAYRTCAITLAGIDAVSPGFVESRK